MSHILEKAISVISQQPNDRKDVDIDLLIPWFKKKSDLFQGATPEVVKDIIRNCQYLHAAQDDVIINQGDIGNSFYIILSGQVAVYIRNTQSDDEDEVSDDEARTKTKERRSRTSSKRASSKTSVGSARHLRDLENGDELPESSDDDNAEGGDDDNEGDDDDTNTVTEAERRASYRPLDRSEFGTHIRFVGAGGSFGELALLHENCVRNASVIANAVTDMIVVDRDLYSRSLKAAQEHELKEKYAFIDTYPLFRKWSMKHKTSVAMGLRAFNIQFGNTIVRQGDPIRGFFFVLHGQAKISMEPALHVTQYPDMCLEKTDSALNGILAELLPGRKVKDKKDKSHNLRLSGPNLSRRRDGYAAAERQRNVRTIDVCLVGSNDIIGDTEIAFNMDTYMQTVTCIQNARVYELDLKNFERLVVKRNPETLKVMKSIVEVKLTSRLNSAKKAKVPLLSILLEKIIEMNKPPPVKDKRRRNEDNELDRRCSKDPLLPPRGPIIDQFGPGSLMYRNKVKEKQRRRFHERRLRTTTRKKADLIDPITGKMNVNPALATQMNTTNNHTQTGKGKTRPYTAPGAITTESTFKGLHAVIEDDDEKDSVYEATDTELSLLEDRIRNWHSYEDETKPLIVPRPQKLHRVKLSKDSWARKRISPRVKGCKSAKSETNINNTKMYMHDRTVAFQENNNHAGDEEFMENSTSGKRSVRWKSASSSGISVMSYASEIHTDGDTAYDSGRESNIESDKEDEATPTGKVSSVPTPSTSPLTSKKYYTLRKIKPSRSYSAEDYKALRELLRKAQKRQGHMLSSSVW